MSQDEPWLVPFDEVYRQLAGPVYRFCLSQVGEPAAAEDVAAQAFASAFAAYQRVRPDRTFHDLLVEREARAPDRWPLATVVAMIGFGNVPL